MHELEKEEKGCGMLTSELPLPVHELTQLEPSISCPGRGAEGLMGTSPFSEDLQLMNC